MPQTSKLVFPPTFNSLSPMKSPFSGHFVKVFPHKKIEIDYKQKCGLGDPFYVIFEKGRN